MFYSQNVLEIHERRVKGRVCLIQLESWDKREWGYYGGHKVTYCARNASGTKHIQSTHQTAVGAMLEFIGAKYLGILPAGISG